jgi:hypothetical protein
MSKLKKVTFRSDAKPYKRKLSHVKTEKKLWNLFLDNQPWAEACNYYISENYSKIEKPTKYNRVHILQMLKIKWEFLSEEEKIPYLLKSKTKFSRDPEGIGYIKGNTSLKNKIEFILETIQPSINKLRNINYEACEKCNGVTYTSPYYGHEFIKYEDDNEEFKCKDKILNLSLQKAKRASQMKPKVLIKCCKCNADIWTSSWYFKGIMQHQSAVDWYMNQYGYKKKTEDILNIQWVKK